MESSDGSGYGRIGAGPARDDRLTKVGFGTPMGELLRRHWQPVCLSAELGELPLKIRILGEDLVAFRDRSGRPGLLYAHCIHRGTSLEFGQIDDDGIRCCYHGWYFDAEGRCLDQPAEPPGSDYHTKLRQPWYPVREYRGLVFAYMGPPDRRPAFPCYENLEVEGAGHVAYRNYTRGVVAACNWLQLQENAIDVWHTAILHTWFHGVHNFTEAYKAAPHTRFEQTGCSVRYFRDAKLANGNRFLRVGEIFVPTARAIAPPSVAGEDPESETEPGRMIGWWVPVDDTHTIGLHIEARPRGRNGEEPPLYQPLEPYERPYEDRQRRPDDWEAQVGQGPIVNHRREHLGVSDTGVVMFRRMLERSLDAIERGEDPVGVRRGPDRVEVPVGARNAVVAPAAP